MIPIGTILLCALAAAVGGLAYYVTSKWQWNGYLAYTIGLFFFALVLLLVKF